MHGQTIGIKSPYVSENFTLSFLLVSTGTEHLICITKYKLPF